MDRVLVRFYDRTNLGDDLLVYLFAHRYENQFTVLLREPCKVLDDLKNVRVKRSNPSRRSLATKVKARLGGQRPDPHANLTRAAKDADLLVYIGGSIFIEHPGKLDAWRREREHYRALDIPYMIVDANFGPYLSPEFPGIVRDILSGADDVCFRDAYSRDMFGALPNVRKAADVGFLAQPPERLPREQADLVISVMDTTDRLDQRSADAYEEAMADLAKRAIESGSRVCLMSFCSYQGDDRAAARILQRLPQPVSGGAFTHEYKGDLEEALSVLAGCRTVIGARFHAVVLGLAFGKAVLPIAYSKKTTDMLSDIGYGGHIIDLTDPAHSWDGADDRAWTMPARDRERLRRSAAEQFTLLDRRLVRSSSEIDTVPTGLLEDNGGGNA